SSGHGVLSRIERRTLSVWAARGGHTSPGPLSGRRSRATRCAARSAVVQPAHNVGASGPRSLNRSHSTPRSDWASGAVDMSRSYAPTGDHRDGRRFSVKGVVSLPTRVVERRVAWLRTQEAEGDTRQGGGGSVVTTRRATGMTSAILMV